MYCEKCGTLLENGKCPNCDKLSKQENKKSNNKGMTIFAIGLSLISIFLLLGGFYVLSSPKTIILQSVSNWNSMFKNGIKDTRSEALKKLLSSDKVKLNETVSFELDPTFGFGFDEISFDLLYNDNKAKKESNFNTKLSIGENALDLNGILKDNKMYVQVKDILTKYYYFDMVYTSLFEQTDNQNLNKFVDIVFDNVKKNVKDSDFKKSKETITLGDKTKKTTKITYQVTTHKLSKLGVDILEDILADKDLMNTFVEMFNQEEQVFKNEIEELIKQLKTVLEKDDQVLFDYNVYYYGFNNIVMEEFLDDEESIQYVHYQNVNEIKVMDIASRVNYFSLKLEEKENKTAISGFVLTYPYSGTYSKNNKKEQLKLSFDFSKDQKLVLDIIEEITDKKDHYKEEGKFTVTGKIGDFDLGRGIQISTFVDVVPGEEIDSSMISDATSFNEMTEEEQREVLSALQNHPLVGPIITFFEQYQSSMLPENSFDTDMDFDKDMDFDMDWDDSSL